jgi:hypothetical protein
MSKWTLERKAYDFPFTSPLNQKPSPSTIAVTEDV